MTSDKFEDLYLEWLYNQVQWDGGKYWDLTRILFDTEFVWFIPNDDNRLEDGLDIRAEFLHTYNDTPEGDDLRERGCSALEVLIGLSRRLSFSVDDDPDYWAWRLLQNLKLTKMHDPLTRRKEVRIREILEQLIFRTYEPNGHGGFFPLAWPEKDMTKVELWYQMSMYIEEMVQE